MRIIDSNLLSKLKSNNYTNLKQKILLYRRKWNNGAFEIESTPIDITNLMDYEGTNAVITQQLDIDDANTWKIGNLVLTIYNKNNCFWEGKYDGYFAFPYYLFGSKIEYYVGDEIINSWVKLFTGYLTAEPTYRQDEMLVEFQVLNRLDFLDTISAEGISTTITNELATLEDETKVLTLNSTVGRILKVLKGESIQTAIELEEKTDYSISQLNEYNLPAKLTLDSALLTGENIYISYLYWKKGIMIDELVLDLLDYAGIDENNRIVDPVIFNNSVRVSKTDFNDVSWAWIYQLNNNDDFTHYINGGGRDSRNSYTISDYNGEHDSYETDVLMKQFGCFMRSGRISFYFNTFGKVGGSGYAVETYVSLVSSSITVGFHFGGAASGSSILSQVKVMVGSNEYSISDGVAEHNFSIEYNSDGQLKFYRDNIVVYSTTISTNLIFTLFRTVAAYSTMAFKITNIEAKPLSELDYVSKPCILMINENTDSQFLGYDRLNANLSVNGVPIANVRVKYKNSGESWTEFNEYTIGTPLSLGYRFIQFLITNDASFGNTVSFNDLRLWHFIQENVALGVCNLTNMSILSALKELASMAMYEIGFDSDDKFFFRSRNKTGDARSLYDNEIIEMTSIYSDLDRLKTKVIITYGEYNKVIDSNTQAEEHPNNIDIYGTRIYELQGGQLLPPDNVDLAYAIAPTAYEELSKLRLKVRLETKMNLELELGDFVKIYHNNILLAKKDFTDYTKWQELGVYARRFKVEGISTNFNTKITTLILTDYSTDEDIPTAESNDFKYNLMMEFDRKK